jgi:hypothetical protein
MGRNQNRNTGGFKYCSFSTIHYFLQDPILTHTHGDAYGMPKHVLEQWSLNTNRHVDKASGQQRCTDDVSKEISSNQFADVLTLGHGNGLLPEYI